MKTTVEIPDELFRRVKARAALEGIPLRDLVVHGLQLAMNELSAGEARRRVQFPLIEARTEAEPLTDEMVAAALEHMAEEELAHDADFV